ncbi:hypothetical protein LTS18_000198, partial [Coniosporium uncinatum]
MEVSRTIATLGTTLLLFGFGLGPLLWGPVSEMYGRKWAVLPTYIAGACFSLGTAMAGNIETVLLTRFATGFFASAPLNVTGGVLNDLFCTEQRAIALVCYGIAVLGGPTIEPIQVTALYMFVVASIDILLIDDTMVKKLLVLKAKRLRVEIKNWALHAQREEEDINSSSLAHRYLVKPLLLLCTPICLLVSLYASFVYSLLYANLGAFPVVYQQMRGWNNVIGAIPFLAFLIGIFIGAVMNIANTPRFVRSFRANGNRPVPEARLPPMMIGSVSFAVSLFVFGWTSQEQIHWVWSCVGATFTGFGFFTIFQSALNYLVDTFTEHSASAIAATTFLRSTFASAFPLSITPMLEKMGIPQ